MDRTIACSDQPARGPHGRHDSPPYSSQLITTEAQLRALIGEPVALACAKISHRMNAMARLFVERSPFVCVATCDAAGNCDLSSHIGLLFMVPGVTDTFRVNGRAILTTDQAPLAPCAVERKPPLPGIDEAYTQCSKALLRSALWAPQRFIEPDTIPTGGQVHRAIQGETFDAEPYDQERAARDQRRLGFYCAQSRSLASRAQRGARGRRAGDNAAPCRRTTHLSVVKGAGCSTPMRSR